MRFGVSKYCIDVNLSNAGDITSMEWAPKTIQMGKSPFSLKPILYYHFVSACAAFCDKSLCGSALSLGF